MLLREYQRAAFDAVLREFDGGRSSTLALMPTGTGKTVLFAHMAEAFRPRGRVMIVAHRDELIHQAAAKVAAVTGVTPEIEMAERWASRGGGFSAASPFVVSSVQTQGTGRMRDFDPAQFGLLIIDEAHHAAAKSYLELIAHYRANPACKVLGVTATGDRGDGEGLARAFESVAYDYAMPDAINDGWLVPVRPRPVAVEGLDFSKCRNVGGDFNQGDLAAVMEFESVLHPVVHATLELACGLPYRFCDPIKNDPDKGAKIRAAMCGREPKRTLVFTVSVKQAEHTADIFSRWLPKSARFVCGETPKDDRRRMLADYAAGKFHFLVNVGIACLDEETEILTLGGWKGIDSISPDDYVANWDQGHIYFMRPKALKVRDRRPGERMAVLETKNRSIRVTEDHRMLYRTLRGGRFKVAHARAIVGKKCQLPISGYADPEAFQVRQEPAPTRAQFARRVTANAYVLRKNGLPAELARAAAGERIGRRASLRYRQPSELTASECRWIGFWLGDGTRTELAGGGVEYVVCQGCDDVGIIDWFEAVCKDAGLTFRRRVQKAEGKRDLIRWSFCRGTGFGPQWREGGVCPIEPYLKKDGTPLLWAMNADQFDALVHGLWMADGDHGEGGPMPATGARIASVNKPFLDLLQAVAVCRGYRANIDAGVARSDNSRPLYRLSLSKRETHDATAAHPIRFEDAPWKPERVWCVTTDSSFLISRRRGTVTVMGNTEGFDSPGIECVVMARPTKSRALVTQMAGRGTRPAGAIAGILGTLPDAAARRRAIAESAKPEAQILDFVGNVGKHKLVTIVDVLAGTRPPGVSDRAKEILQAEPELSLDDAIANAEQIEGAYRDLREAEEESLADSLDQSDEDSLLARSARATGLVGTTNYAVGEADAFDVRHNGPSLASVPSARGGATDPQINLLVKLGVRRETAVGYGKQQASAVIESLKGKRCSDGQARVLRRAGFSGDEINTLNFDKASAAIEILRANGWQRPEAGAAATPAAEAEEVA